MSKPPVWHELLHVCKQSGARYGILHTPHGSFETPIFMPVGTQATVKTLLPSEIEEVSQGLILANTYHLWLQPGDELVKKHGGVRGFMKWNHALLTDSGGFQVFSLSKLRKITEEGVTFRHHKNGSKLFLSPEKAMDIQNNLGADIIMSFDECPPFDSTYKYMKNSVDRTLRWAKRGKDHHKNTDNQALFGIIQGGPYEDLRQYCAKKLVEMDFPGYAIGGLSVGESKQDMYKVLDFVKDIMPEDKPRYLMGVGSPDDLIEASIRKMDMYDCVLATRIARHGTVFTYSGKLNMKNARFIEDFSPLDEDCDCYVCKTFTKSYLCHLVRAKEHLSARLLSYHNLYHLKDVMKKVREAIKEDRLLDFKEEYFKKANYKL